MDYSTYTISDWRNMQLDPFPTSNDPFFHYTPTSTCFSMMKYYTPKDEDSYMELWATHVRFMNDSEEMVNGYKYIRKYLERSKGNEFKKTLVYFEKYLSMSNESNVFTAINPNHFAVCFCGDGDLLSQWTYYGESGGVAIEYDLKNCEFCGYCSNIKDFVKRDAFNILYKNDDKEGAIKAVWRREFETSDIDYKCQIKALRLLSLVSLMKNLKFQGEKESRLLFAPVYIGSGNGLEVQKNKNTALSLINFRERKGSVIPYIKIKVRHKEKNKFPIKSIIIGPGTKQKQMFNSMILFVKSNFQSDTPICKPDKHNEWIYYVNGIKISCSEIPFRG